MGDLSEDIIDGSCCQLCMSYFTDGDGGIYVHGEPVICKDCYNGLSKEEKTAYVLAKANTM